MQFNSRSFYQHDFPITITSYTGPRYDKKAMVLPGQGSSVPGMFRLELKKSAVFQDLFAKADLYSQSKNIGKVSDYINGHEQIDKKHLPFIRNLALYTSQVSLFRHLREQRLHADVLTGHSFGEYGVLACAEVLSFEDMLEVVYHRDLFSPGFNDVGTMIALSASAEQFKTLTPPVPYVIANVNSPQQIVLSVAQGDVKAMSEFLKKNRIAARPMESVGRPYHSHWMAAAQKQFQEWLNQQNFKIEPAKVAILSSVNRKIYEKGHQFDRQEFNSILAQQLTEPVLFIEQAELLKKRNIHSFVELGVAATCVSFIKASLENHDIVSLSAQQLLSAGAEDKKNKHQFSIDTKNNKFFKLLAKYIGDITGYDIEDITVSDSFQEDLQIDSIKKAEIVFKVLEASRLAADEGVSISQLQQVGDVVEYIEKLEKAGGGKAAPTVRDREFKLLMREWKPSPHFEKPLTQLPLLSEVDIKVGSGFDIKPLLEKFNEASTSQHLLLVRVAPASGFIDTSWVESILLKFGELIDESPLTNRDLRIVLTAEQDGPLFRGLLAFLKSLQKETNGYFLKSVLNDDRKDIRPLLLQELADRSALDVRYQGGQRLTPHFTELPLLEVPQNKVIFSVGGNKGILEAVYQQFPASHKCSLFIMGRSAEDHEAIQKSLKKIKKNFKSVTYFQGDIRKIASLQEAVKKAEALYGNIDVFINAAGVEVSKKFLEQSHEEIRDQLNSKFESLQNLLSVAQGKKAQVITFSSVVSHFGNEGQTVYSFANGYLDQMENCRHIHWPPMDGIGMTSNVGILQKLRSFGVSLMNKKEAARLFTGSLAPQPGLSDVFYLDIKDILLNELFLRDLQELRKVIGDIADPARLIFAKSYDLKQDSYLRDHHIESTSVVAAATGIAAFMTAGSHYFKTLPLIEDFTIKNMILVTDKENYCFFKSEFQAVDSIQMKLVSQADHFTAQLKKNFSVAAPPRMSSFKAEHSIDMESFYSVRSIDYGPKFQVIEKAYHNSAKDVVAVGKSAAPYLTGLALNDYMSFLIELGFQAIYLKNVILGKGLGIPLKISQIIPHKFEITDTVYAVPTAQIKDTDGRMIYGDAHLYNGKGEMILEIKGVEMSTIRLYESAPFGSVPNQWEYHGV